MKNKELEKIAKEVQDIIAKSKATFFIKKGKGKLPEIPTNEALYELKAEISDSVAMYFYKKLHEK